MNILMMSVLTEFTKCFRWNNFHVKLYRDHNSVVIIPILIDVNCVLKYFNIANIFAYMHKYARVHMFVCIFVCSVCRVIYRYNKSR